MKTSNFPLCTILLLLSISAFSQVSSCVCKEFIYLNEPVFNNPSLSRIHKYEVCTNGSLTEIGNPWLISTGEFPYPHGLGSDINGFFYVAEAYSVGDIRRLTCTGASCEIFFQRRASPKLGKNTM